LLDVVAGDAVYWSPHARRGHRRSGESDLADVGVERVVVDVLGELRLVSPWSRDRLLEHLHHR